MKTHTTRSILIAVSASCDGSWDLSIHRYNENDEPLEVEVVNIKNERDCFFWDFSVIENAIMENKNYEIEIQEQDGHFFHGVEIL